MKKQKIVQMFTEAMGICALTDQGNTYILQWDTTFENGQPKKSGPPRWEPYELPELPEVE